MRRISGASALLLLLFLAMLGCNRPQESKEAGPPPAKVNVALPLQKEIASSEEFNGRIDATETVSVQAKVQGYLIRDDIPEGAEVKKDDLLFEIDPRPFKTAVDAAQAQLAGAEASLKLANAELGRARVLRGSASLSAEELEIRLGNQAVATADVGKVKATLEKAKLDLDYTKITAPISGRVSRKIVTKGNLIAPSLANQTLTTLVAEEKVHVYFNADERSLLRYERRSAAKGAPSDTASGKVRPLPIDFRLEEEQAFPHKGVIDFVDNRVDPDTGTILIRAIVDNPKSASGRRVFIPGLRAKVRIKDEEPFKALLITERAVMTDLRRKLVWVVDEKGEVERREIRLGTSPGDGLVDVIEGLKATDRVIVQGIQKVRPGVKVDASVVEMPSYPTR